MFLTEDVAGRDRFSPSPQGVGCEPGTAEMNGPVILF